MRAIKTVKNNPGVMLALSAGYVQSTQKAMLKAKTRDAKISRHPHTGCVKPETVTGVKLIMSGFWSYRKAAKMAGVSPETLRRNFARLSELIGSGVPIPLIMVKQTKKQPTNKTTTNQAKKS